MHSSLAAVMSESHRSAFYYASITSFDVSGWHYFRLAATLRRVQRFWTSFSSRRPARSGSALVQVAWDISRVRSPTLYGTSVQFWLTDPSWTSSTRHPRRGSALDRSRHSAIWKSTRTSPMFANAPSLRLLQGRGW